MAARKNLFNAPAFKEFSYQEFSSKIQNTGLGLREILRDGWKGTDLNGYVDAAIVPTVVLGARPQIELSIIDSKAHVLAAAKEELTDLADGPALERAISSIGAKISRVFPFEGSVLKKDGDRIVINMGRSQGRGLKIGDQLDLYGLQAEKFGHSQVHEKIAKLTVKSVADSTSVCSVGALAPRARIDRGDLVALRMRALTENNGAQIKVVTARGLGVAPVAQANVYFNEVWLGATDSTGRMPVSIKGSGTLKVIKHGFADAVQAMSSSEQKVTEIVMTQRFAMLKIDSKPSGAEVKIDGISVGKTPLAAPASVPSGFIKLTLSGLPGYKTHTSVLDLDQGALELVGDAAIRLERDYRATAKALIKEGKTKEALEVLNTIPTDHSDYLIGRHEAGELYLNNFDQPAKAAEAFGKVTASEAVKQFNDKRFIASHIDEGIALFGTAEKLAANQPEVARAHYQKALEVLERTLPYLRFVSPEEHAAAVHNVEYHRALCRHRLWAVTQDPKMLVDTVRGWRSYLDGSARSIATDDNSRGFVENAEIYLKQATASLNASRGISRQ